ncbi:MAG TPA: hypothetical protein VKA13_04550, partial [Gammaproteobacteria bacterium]|nr:hypothetical protein [Gammaproteobacteria bacterium]
MSGPKKGIRVAPSPLNPVKLELALVIVGALLLLAIQARLSADPLVQLLWLGGYGLAAMAWLVWRTRRVLITGAKKGSDPVFPENGKNRV